MNNDDVVVLFDDKSLDPVQNTVFRDIVEAFRDSIFAD